MYFTDLNASISAKLIIFAWFRFNELQLAHSEYKYEYATWSRC